MNQPIVLTVIAQDQPGIVQRVSTVLREHGGSWNRSSMSRLAGRFAGILQGVVPVERAEACLAAFEALQEGWAKRTRPKSQRRITAWSWSATTGRASWRRSRRC